MSGCTRPRPMVSRRLLLVVGALELVHPGLLHRAFVAGGGTAEAAGKRKGATTGAAAPARDGLPAPVHDMIGLIREAADARDIELLRDAIDWNEMKPDFGADGVADAIAHFKAISADGSGRDILEVLAALLAAAPAVLPFGRDLENNRLFVWPRFADTPPARLSGEDLAAFERLVPEAALRAAMVQDGRYRGWRLVLGADGTWHTFRRDK
jgi:hypothetical protein